MSRDIDQKSGESLYMEMSRDNDQKKERIKATVSSSKSFLNFHCQKW